MEVVSSHLDLYWRSYDRFIGSMSRHPTWTPDLTYPHGLGERWWTPGSVPGLTHPGWEPRTAPHTRPGIRGLKDPHGSTWDTRVGIRGSGLDHLTRVSASFFLFLASDWSKIMWHQGPFGLFSYVFKVFQASYIYSCNLLCEIVHLFSQEHF